MHALAHLPVRSASLRLLTSTALVVGLVLVPVALGQQPSGDPTPEGGAADTGINPELAGFFDDFLHYARLGRFTEARAFATKLLEHPDLDPLALLAIADRDRGAIDSLVTVINNSSIGAEAQRVLDVLREGELLRRQDPKRINLNIEKLGGPPQTEYNAIQHLIDSGEYAIPWMVQVLSDPSRQALWPRLVKALPQIGQPAVTPLAMALSTDDRNLRQMVIGILGEIGYPHAVPYLQKVLTGADLDDDTRRSVEQALGKIERRSGRGFAASAADEFVRLGEQYYGEYGALRVDSRRSTANAWYWRDGFVEAVDVPQDIFGPVMAMRCAEEALRLDPDREEALALWLAGNIRREARLGLDVESADDVGAELDASRPAEFPRAIYFSRAAGPRYCLKVLDRAVTDLDTSVALGAIAALRGVAGETSLVGYLGDQQPLTRALLFPDAVVRIKAALALAEARPKSRFSGMEWVVPVLSEALVQTGSPRFVVIDPDRTRLNGLVEFLRQGGAEVVAATDFQTAVKLTRSEFGSVSGIFASTSLENPGLRTAVAQLRREFLFKMTPVLLLRADGDYETARALAADDPRVGHVAAELPGAELAEAMNVLMVGSGRQLIDQDQALALAIETTDALHILSTDGRSVLNVAVAEPSLRAVLDTADDEGLRRKSAAVLAMSRAQTAQCALARIALDDAQAEALRVAVFTALADSAKLNGNLLSDDFLTRLVETSADEPNLTLRTAASRALGALNLADNRASEIVRKYYQG